MDKVLGKGLKAIIKTNNSEENERYLAGQISISKIIPNENQPREYFNNKQMDELIASIKENGVLQPITVRELQNDTYQIIAGERRYRAASYLNLKWIPAYTVQIKDESKLMEYALIENIQRVNLNTLEEAEGYALLKGKYNFTQEEIAKKVSKSRSEISNKLRLLKLPKQVKDGLRKNEITYGHARALLTLKKSIPMISIYNKILNSNLSVRQTESIIKSYINQSKTKVAKNSNKELINYRDELNSLLNTDIKINQSNNGLVKITFKSITSFKKLIKKLRNE